MWMLVPPLVGALVQVLGATLRVTLSGVAPLVPLWHSKRPLIYVVWHGRTLMGPWVNARLRASHGARAPRVLVSLSRNGGLMARFVGRFGLDVVRGSSAAGAPAAAVPTRSSSPGPSPWPPSPEPASCPSRWPPTPPAACRRGTSS